MGMRRDFSLLLATLSFCLTSYFTTLNSIVQEHEKAVSTSSEKSFVVVIDAGHGGIDGGVTGRKTGVKESELNLDISFYIRDELESAGFEVVLTRKTDAGLYGTTAKGFKKRDMQRRKEVILEANPALLISVHQNFYSSRTPRGAQVFYLKSSEESKKLAVCVQEKLNDLYAQERVKSRVATASEYYILKCCDAPSLIIECGFLSNEKDDELLSKENYRKEIAKRIFYGVVKYYAQT
jgi:N-acetylmuramoyl-L-alanine amidase